MPHHVVNGHVTIFINFDDANLTEELTCPTFKIGRDSRVNIFFTRTNLLVQNLTVTDLKVLS